MSPARPPKNRGGKLLDLSALIAGTSPSVHYAGWLLAGFGARVTRTAHVAADTNVAAFLGQGSSMSSDPQTALRDGADVVIGDESIDWGFVGEGMSVVVEPWGKSGPYLGQPESEMLLASLGGATDFTSGPDGQPVYGFGRRYLYIAGLYAAIAILAKFRAGHPARGAHPHLRVSQLEAVASVLPYATAQFAYNGSSETVEQSGPRFTCRCTDGFVVIYSGGAWEPQMKMIHDDSLLRDPRFVSITARFANAGDLGEIFQTWCRDLSVAQVMARAGTTSVAVAPVSQLSEVLVDEQLEHLQAWSEIEVDGVLGRVPRPPFIVLDAPASAEGSVGASNIAPPVALPSTSESSGADQDDRDERLPLKGSTILDLTHVWSGPMASKVLAGLGAEVLKVEGPARWDFLRGSGTSDVRRRYPDLEYGPDPFNRNAWFNSQNTDKRSVVVDLKDVRGTDMILKMAAKADVVLANMRPGVLERLGLGDEDLRRVNPNIVLVEMPGYGNDGPMRDFAAYGAQFEALSGAANMCGDEAAPLITGFALADPVAGLHSALAVVAALENRDRTGQGARIQSVQRDGMLAMMGEYLLAASLGQATDQPLNGADGTGFHEIVQCADDAWVAIDATGPGAESRLEKFLVSCAPTGEDLRSRVLSWTAKHHRGEVEDLLGDAGVPAARVQNAEEVFGDPQLRHNDFFVALEHPSVGVYDYPGLPFTDAHGRLGPRTAAPQLDADTDAVLREWAGLDESKIAQLRSEGVIGIAAELSSGPLHETKPTQGHCNKYTGGATV